MSNEIRIGSQIVEVKEVTIEQILNMWDSLTKESSIIDIIKLVVPCVTSLSFDDVKKLKPSEIAKIIKEVKEKNMGFLEIADCFGMKETVVKMAQNMRDNILVDIRRVSQPEFKVVQS